MPISMPASPGFTASSFGLETNTRTFESPLSRYTQRVILQGSRWQGSWTLPKMTRIQFAPWQAFLMQLEGQANTFYGFDPDARTPRGVATGTPLVKNGSQTGSSLTTDGWTAGIVGILKAGDYFSVNGELKMVTADVTSDGSGNATLTFKPPLRSSPADNAPITVTNCTVPMILKDDGQAMWQTGSRLGIYDSFTFSAIEAF